MVSRIGSGNTSQFEVMQWVVAQGQHLSTTEMCVLYYLAVNAFYREDNPEGAEIGQVMFGASKVEAIQAGTGLRSRTAVRTALNSLQDKAYVQREGRARLGPLYGSLPHVIHVLWDLEALREGLRAGTRTLPQALRDRPTAPPPRVQEMPKLALVRDLPMVTR